MSRPFYYKKNLKGDPILGSNLKATKKPSSAHTQIVNIINAPLPDNFKPSFSTNNRFFIQIDVNGEPVRGSLIKSSVIPEGTYLELFKNNILTTPKGTNSNSGVLEDDIEDIAGLELVVSEDLRLNGYRTSYIKP